MREFLERNHTDSLDRSGTIELTIKSLLEVVQTGAKNIEIAVMTPGNEVSYLQAEEIEKIVEKIWPFNGVVGACDLADDEARGGLELAVKLVRCGESEQLLP